MVTIDNFCTKCMDERNKQHHISLKNVTVPEERNTQKTDKHYAQHLSKLIDEKRPMKSQDLTVCMQDECLAAVNSETYQYRAVNNLCLPRKQLSKNGILMMWLQNA